MTALETTLTTTITGLSHEGRGIGKLDGKTVFVRGALQGEEVAIRVLRKHRKWLDAEVVEVLKASPDRITPKCQHFGQCGGCSLQHLDSEKQIAIKQAMVLEQVQQAIGYLPAQILPALTADVWGYRTKARLGAKYVTKKEKLIIGFRETNGRYIADLSRCEILHPSVGHKLPEFAQLIASLSIYQQVPQLEIAAAQDATAIIVRHLQPFSDEDLEKLKQFAIEHQFHLYLQPKGTDSVHRLWPEQGIERLHYSLETHGLQYQYHPTDFTQVNLPINAKMVTQALNLLQLSDQDSVLDLFCGLGNFTLPMAQLAREVIGVEGSGTMVSRASDNASANGISNTQFYTANLDHAELDKIVSTRQWLQRQYNKVLLDPPRSGAATIINFLPTWQPERVVYVSCNPSTFARDAASINLHGYELTSLGVMDMFPHTHHVEVMGLFVKAT